MQWADHQWNAEWADKPTRLRTLIPDNGTHTPGMTLPRTAWVWLNRHRTCVGRSRSCLCKCGVASSAACECGAEQTVDHVILYYPMAAQHLPRYLGGLAVDKRRTHSNERRSPNPDRILNFLKQFTVRIQSKFNKIHQSHRLPLPVVSLLGILSLVWNF